VDEVTIGELRRLLEAHQRDIRDDFVALQTRLDQYVLREVYDADRRGLLERMARIDAEVLTLREANRKTMWTAVTSFLAPLIVAVVLAVVLRGGA
jgi:hypothetical protein